MSSWNGRTCVDLRNPLNTFRILYMELIYKSLSEIEWNFHQSLF